MKAIEEAEAKRSNKIEEAYNQLRKLQEQLPSYLNDESEIIGTDPQELNISFPPSSKEKGCINFLLSKKKAKEIKVEEIKEEVEEWDMRAEAAGRFDEKGNFILEELPPQDESSNGEDWVTVDQKAKKKKQKEKEEQVTYTAVQTIEKKPAPAVKHPKKPVVKPKESKEESETDSDGFKIVHDRKSKKNKKHPK